MKIQILSDLHHEVCEFEPVITDANVVVLAGDIAKGLDGLEIAHQFSEHQHVVYIAGNHEFYGSTRPELLAKMRAAPCSPKVHFLENDEIIINGVRFLGCTLWTDFQLYGIQELPWAIYQSRSHMPDYKAITEGIEDDKRLPFTPDYSIKLFRESVEWLKARLDEDFDGKTVVVTHHLPSILSVSERFKDSLLSASFASNLGHLFVEKIDLWIHGHTHDKIDYVENGTRVVCNPRGYVWYGCNGQENQEFDPAFTVEI